MSPERISSNKIPPRKERVNKILSLAGLASRRKADELIKAGRIRVNGLVIKEPGARALWGVDSIALDGQEIPEPFERVYLMLNKPFGYICALSDPAGRPVASDLLRDVKERVYPVGRLDFDTLGLLLLTNDGEWAHRLTHPRYHVPRTYKITLEGKITDESLNRLRKGIRLKDGPTGPCKATPIQRDEQKSVIRMTITMGRSRMLRRMVDAVGYKVIHLIRTGFGNLELGELKIGNYRHLESHEIRAMKKMVRLA
jgi:pseudouridine synthase